VRLGDETPGAGRWCGPAGGPGAARASSRAIVLALAVAFASAPALVIAFGFALAGCGSGSPLVKRVQRFQALRAAGEKEKALAFVADSARVWYDAKEGPGRPWRLDGPWARWDEHFRASRVFTGWRVEGNAVSVTSTETNDFYRLTEREPWPVRLTWWFDGDGKIAEYFVRPLRDERPQSRLDEFKAWAAARHPDVLEYLMPGGQISPEGDRPERWRAILVEWRADAGLPAMD